MKDMPLRATFLVKFIFLKWEPKGKGAVLKHSLICLNMFIGPYSYYYISCIVLTVIVTVVYTTYLLKQVTTWILSFTAFSSFFLLSFLPFMFNFPFKNKKNLLLVFPSWTKSYLECKDL